jgi:hypothetical protein
LHRDTSGNSRPRPPQLAASSSGSRGRHFSPGIRNGPQQPGQRNRIMVQELG